MLRSKNIEKNIFVNLIKLVIVKLLHIGCIFTSVRVLLRFSKCFKILCRTVFRTLSIVFDGVFIWNKLLTVFPKKRHHRYRIDTVQKWSFPLRISSVNVTRFGHISIKNFFSKCENFFTFTEKILSGKLHFLGMRKRTEANPRKHKFSTRSYD